MPDFMMIMKGDGKGGTAAEWEQYSERVSRSGIFRGGSALGNGTCCMNSGRSSQSCTVTGFMRFEAASIDDVLALVPENPVIKSGGEVEVLELVKT